MIALGVDRYARLRRLSRDELLFGLNVYGSQIDAGDTGIASVFAAYCDEVERRLLAGTGMAL